MEKEICSLKELRGVLGDDVVENMLPAPGDAIEYYWDRSETNPFDIDVLQDWIDDCLPDVLGRHESDGYYYQPENFNRDLPAAEVLPTSLAEYLEERMLASDWLADWRDATIREMADDALDSLETALRSHPECDGMGLDEPSLRPEIAELIEERTFVALGLGDWLDEPACVTAYVGTRAELSADTSTVPRLIHAALSSASHDEFLERCSEGDGGEQVGHRQWPGQALRVPGRGRPLAGAPRRRAGTVLKVDAERGRRVLVLHRRDRRLRKDEHTRVGGTRGHGRPRAWPLGEGCARSHDHRTSRPHELDWPLRQDDRRGILSLIHI